ncbi:MAG: amidohydrolase family protein [Spirochaetaceae bacterium]|nr:amidohydrolase family protein [Spirochaetaceae bacterium]
MKPRDDSPRYDVIITAGRVLCAAAGLDGPGAVAVRGGRIAAAGPDVSGTAREWVSFPDGLLIPGLVDLHAHPARGGSRYGIDPDEHLLKRGVTTVLSQGDAGAGNWPDYRDRVIGASRTRVRLAIHLSRRGESDPDCPYGSLADADVDACVAAIEDGGADIWGIAVNTGPSIGMDPHPVLDRALQAAGRTGRPLLFGTRMDSDWPLDKQLLLLRAGDVVTYCFNPLPEGLVRDGRVRACVREARLRGVLFDIGHGMASFSFPVAEAAIGEGFWPDTISSDQYHRHVGSRPQHDLALTVSKVIAAGMPEREAFRRATLRPAEVLGLEGEVGSLRPGTCADLTVLERAEGGDPVPLRDVDGVERHGARWEPRLTVRAGKAVASTTP